MLACDVIRLNLEDDLFTLVLPTGNDGNWLAVLTGWVVRGDDVFPVYGDITTSEPLYMTFRHLRWLLGPFYAEANFWEMDAVDIYRHKE